MATEPTIAIKKADGTIIKSESVYGSKSNLREYFVTSEGRAMFGESLLIKRVFFSIEKKVLFFNKRLPCFFLFILTCSNEVELKGLLWVMSPHALQQLKWGAFIIITAPCFEILCTSSITLFTCSQNCAIKRKKPCKLYNSLGKDSVETLPKHWKLLGNFGITEMVTQFLRRPMRTELLVRQPGPALRYLWVMMRPST